MLLHRKLVERRETGRPLRQFSFNSENLEWGGRWRERNVFRTYRACTGIG